MSIDEIATKKDLAEMEQRILNALLSKPKQDDGCISMEDAVKYIGAKSKSTIYKLTSSGELAYHKIGKANVFKKVDLDRYLSRKRRASNAEISSKTYIKLKSKPHNYDPFSDNF